MASSSGARRALALAFGLAIAMSGAACPAPDDDDDDAGEGEGEGDVGEGEGEGEGEGDGAGEGEGCIFNDDCASDLRCGCDAGLCLCETGARGTGVNGVDICVDENDCESAVCAEDSEGTSTCSGPCVDDSDCEARLPRCIDVAFIGRICVREP